MMRETGRETGEREHHKRSCRSATPLDTLRLPTFN